MHTQPLRSARDRGYRPTTPIRPEDRGEDSLTAAALLLLLPRSGHCASRKHGARLRLRAERGPSPQELVKQASLAARLQDLDIIRLEAGIERREPAQWDELRVWDPGDG